MKRALFLLLITAANADAAVCLIDTVAAVSFGTYNPLTSSPTDSSGTITYSCSSVGANDTLVITLSSGTASSPASRELASGSNRLSYNLFLDAARTLIWGDGSSGTSSYGPVQASAGDTTLNVYGRIAARQNIAAGTYGDVVVVTIHY